MGFLESFLGAYSDGAQTPSEHESVGLLELVDRARASLEYGTSADFAAPFVTMLERHQKARRQRQEELQPVAHRYDEELLSLFEDCFEQYESLENALNRAAQTLREGASREALLVVLQQVDQSALALQSVSEEIVEITACGALVCPHCGMPGQTPLCPNCGVDCFYPDTEEPLEPLGALVLPTAYREVHTRYSAVLRGEGLLEELLESLDPLEQALEESEEMVQQMASDRPEDDRIALLVDVVDDCLEGIAQMRAVVESRKVRDLHEGWANLATSSVELCQLLPSLSHGTLA